MSRERGEARWKSTQSTGHGFAPIEPDSRVLRHLGSLQSPKAPVSEEEQSARERERERQSKASPNFGESKIAIPDPTEKAKRERKSGRFLPLDRKLP
jgi:hypothetical protein